MHPSRNRTSTQIHGSPTHACPSCQETEAAGAWKGNKTTFPACEGDRRQCPQITSSFQSNIPNQTRSPTSHNKQQNNPDTSRSRAAHRWPLLERLVVPEGWGVSRPSVHPRQDQSNDRMPRTGLTWGRRPIVTAPTHANTTRMITYVAQDQPQNRTCPTQLNTITKYSDFVPPILVERPRSRRCLQLDSLWEFRPGSSASVPPKFPDEIPGGFILNRRDGASDVADRPA